MNEYLLSWLGYLHKRGVYAHRTVSWKRQPDTCHYDNVILEEKEPLDHVQAKLRSKISDHATCIDAFRSQNRALLAIIDEVTGQYLRQWPMV
jgi:hypothetical protein